MTSSWVPRKRIQWMARVRIISIRDQSEVSLAFFESPCRIRHFHLHLYMSCTQFILLYLPCCIKNYFTVGKTRVLGPRPKFLGFYISGLATCLYMKIKRHVKDRERRYITWHGQSWEEMK
jgi:hypothetical protein